MMYHTFLLFNISGGEFVIVALIFLVLFGPGKIPEIARGAAKAIKSIRNAANDVKRDIMDSTDDAPLTEIKKTVKEGSQVINEVTDAVKRGTKL